jgi:hypothetical protein
MPFLRPFATAHIKPELLRFEQLDASLPFPRWLRRVREEALGYPPDTSMSIAEAKGVVVQAVAGRAHVGYARASRPSAGYRDVALTEVAVVEAQRRGGTGMKLIGVVASIMAQRGYETMNIVSLRDGSRARREEWFRRMGFRLDDGFFVAELVDLTRNLAPPQLRD